MSIHHFLTALKPARRHPRPRAAAWRGRARRGWLVQRLEPRCVLAADVFFDLDATETEQIDTRELTPQTEVPALLASTKPQNDVHSDGDQAAPWEHESVVEQPPPELIAEIDLSHSQSIEIEVQASQSLILTLAPAPLDRLFAQSETLTVQVVFDATRWQLPISPSDDAGIGFEVPEQADASPGFNGQIHLVSLASQSMRLEATIQPGDVDAGTSTQIVIKLIDNEAAISEAPENFQTEELELLRDWISMDSTSPSIGEETVVELAGKSDSHFDLTTTIDPSDNGEPSTNGPVEAWTGGEPGQSLEGSAASPLPETQRGNAERGPRHARRTLDIRPSNSIAWSAPSSSSRSAVSPGSLATQKAIASVYDENAVIGTAQARSMLDPKPARLQVATFVLSRVDHRDTPIAMNTTKPVSKTSHPSNTARALVPTSAVESTSQPISRSTDSNTNDNKSLVRMAAVPTVAEVTIDVRSVRSAEMHADDDDAAKEQAFYAGIVDRLFGSPVTLVAVLGLTIIVRFNEGEGVD